MNLSIMKKNNGVNDMSKKKKIKIPKSTDELMEMYSYKRKIDKELFEWGIDHHLPYEVDLLKSIVQNTTTQVFEVGVGKDEKFFTDHILKPLRNLDFVYHRLNLLEKKLEEI